MEPRVQGRPAPPWRTIRRQPRRPPAISGLTGMATCCPSRLIKKQRRPAKKGRALWGNPSASPGLSPMQARHVSGEALIKRLAADASREAPVLGKRDEQHVSEQNGEGSMKVLARAMGALLLVAPMVGWPSRGSPSRRPPSARKGAADATAKGGAHAERGAHADPDCGADACSNACTDPRTHQVSRPDSDSSDGYATHNSAPLRLVEWVLGVAAMPLLVPAPHVVAASPNGGSRNERGPSQNQAACTKGRDTATRDVPSFHKKASTGSIVIPVSLLCLGRQSPSTPPKVDGRLMGSSLR